MGSFGPTRPETLEDQARYLNGYLVEVSCLDCRARVLVRKHSEPHTSIQWTDEAVGHCSEFARRGPHRPVSESCPRLKASIEAAVRDGVVEVGAKVD